MGKLIIFSAPSGAGKSTIVHYLLGKGLHLQFSISATSRPPRGTEQQAVDYYFYTPQEFRDKIDKGEFLEYEEVYPNRYYGTLAWEVERILALGGNVLLDVDVVGGCTIKKLYGSKALSVFVEPPSIEELRRRLVARNTDTPEGIDIRIAKATHEMSFAPQFDVILHNDNLEEAQEEALRLVTQFVEIDEK